MTRNWRGDPPCHGVFFRRCKSFFKGTTTVAPSRTPPPRFHLRLLSKLKSNSNYAASTGPAHRAVRVPSGLMGEVRSSRIVGKSPTKKKPDRPCMLGELSLAPPHQKKPAVAVAVAVVVAAVAAAAVAVATCGRGGRGDGRGRGRGGRHRHRHRR